MSGPLRSSMMPLLLVTWLLMAVMAPYPSVIAAEDAAFQDMCDACTSVVGKMREKIPRSPSQVADGDAVWSSLLAGDSHPAEVCQHFNMCQQHGEPSSVSLLEERVYLDAADPRSISAEGGDPSLSEDFPEARSIDDVDYPLDPLYDEPSELGDVMSARPISRRRRASASPSASAPNGQLRREMPLPRQAPGPRYDHPLKEEGDALWQDDMEAMSPRPVSHPHTERVVHQDMNSMNNQGHMPALDTPAILHREVQEAVMPVYNVSSTVGEVEKAVGRLEERMGSLDAKLSNLVGLVTQSAQDGKTGVGEVIEAVKTMLAVMNTNTQVLYDMHDKENGILENINGQGGSEVWAARPTPSAATSVNPLPSHPSSSSSSPPPPPSSVTTPTPSPSPHNNAAPAATTAAKGSPASASPAPAIPAARVHVVPNPNPKP